VTATIPLVVQDKTFVPNDAQLAMQDETWDRKFKTPKLRNVDLRPYSEFVKTYGFFKYLDAMDGIIHFYAWRAMMDTGTMFGGMGPNPNMLPESELDENRIVVLCRIERHCKECSSLVAELKVSTDG